MIHLQKAEDPYLFFLGNHLDCSIVAGPWIAGGAVWRSVLGEDIDQSDYDIYVRNHDQYIEVFNRIMMLKDASVLFTSENAVTFNWRRKLQIIKHSKDSIQDVLSSFDFTVCQFGTDGKDIVTISELNKQDLQKRVLELANPSKLTPKIVPRVAKYMQYGFAPSKEIVEAMCNMTGPMDFSTECEYAE